MRQEDCVIIKNVFIIISENKKIYYCNQNIDNGMKIINELNIMNYIGSGSIGSIFINNYLIEIERFQVNGENLYHVVIERCICEEMDLPYSTYMDYHTGLYNRNLWESMNSGLIKMSITDSYSIIIIDVDNLKKLNDKMGHTIGDYAIKIVSNSIKDVIKKEDIAIRYGGDEFLIILPDVNRDMARKVVDRIRRRITKNNLDKNISIKISAGVSVGDKLEHLNKAVEEADYNMYIQKRHKKGIKDSNTDKVIIN